MKIKDFKKSGRADWLRREEEEEEGREPEDFDASSREIAQVGEPTLVRNRR